MSPSLSLLLLSSSSLLLVLLSFIIFNKVENNELNSLVKLAFSINSFIILCKILHISWAFSLLKKFSFGLKILAKISSLFNSLMIFLNEIILVSSVIKDFINLLMI